MRRPTSPLLLLLLLLLPAAGSLSCGSSGEGRSGSQLASGRFQGTVAETMDGGGYTYVRLERGGESIWAAAPQTTVQVGQEIAVDLGMKMDGFRSEALDRTFESLYFVNHLDSGGTASTDPHADLQSGRRETASTSIDPASIDVPDGGLRVAQIWEQRQALAGTEVTVRGRVVKVTNNVMGRNWIHLQDGTGDDAGGTHDLTVTSQASALVGDVATVRGKVVVDRDFGSGYKYGLLLEEATLKVQ